MQGGPRVIVETVDPIGKKRHPALQHPAVIVHRYAESIDQAGFSRRRKIAADGYYI